MGAARQAEDASPRAAPPHAAAVRENRERDTSDASSPATCPPDTSGRDASSHVLTPVADNIYRLHNSHAQSNHCHNSSDGLPCTTQGYCCVSGYTPMVPLDTSRAAAPHGRREVSCSNSTKQYALHQNKHNNDVEEHLESLLNRNHFQKL